MDENRFYILGSKKLSGELTSDEVIEFDLILLRNPQFEEIYLQLSNSFSGKKTEDHQQDERLIARLRQKLAGTDYPVTQPEKEPYPELVFEKTTWQKLRMPLMVTCLLLIIGAGLVRYSLKETNAAVIPSMVFENNISTKPGSKTQVKLPDGTKVYLNADSKLSYPDNFLGNTREVTLEGEAFFEVTENKNKPFIIHAKSMDIKVLGTVFNVKAYPSENNSEASLLRGSIEVTLKNRTNEKILLKPNEKITVRDAVVPSKENTALPAKKLKFDEGVESAAIIAVDHLVPDQTEHIIREIGWTKNKLMFRNESLESIARIMERWYGRTIEIRTEKLKDKKFTANFTEESFMQVLLALQASSGFNIKRENTSIILY